jgi:hypothetical protein
MYAVAQFRRWHAHDTAQDNGYILIMRIPLPVPPLFSVPFRLGSGSMIFLNSNPFQTSGTGLNALVLGKSVQNGSG